MQSKKQEIVQKRLQTLEKEREDRLEINKNKTLSQQFKTDFDRLDQINENMMNPDTERVTHNSSKNTRFF